MGPDKGRVIYKAVWNNLGTLSADATGKLDVLGHDGDTLGVDGTQVGVLEEANQVSLRGFLQSHDGRGLETEVSLEVLGDLTDQTLEGELPDEELGTLLVTTDLTKGNGTGPVTVRFLDTTGGRGGLASSLCGQLLARSLASGRLSGGLLCTSHGGNKNLLKFFESFEFIGSAAEQDETPLVEIAPHYTRAWGG